TVRQVEFSKLVARLFTADLRDEAAVLVVLHDAVVAVAVRDEDVALWIPTHIRRTTESVFLRRWIRAGRCDDGPVNGWRPPPDHPQHLALRAELGDQIGTLIDSPDVVVLVDANRVGDFEAVVALPDLPEEGAVRV